MSGPQSTWTKRDLARLKKLRESGMKWNAISARMARPRRSIQEKFYEISEFRSHEGRRKVNSVSIVPHHAEIERELRELARQNQNLTGAFFGDPPPGFSALERR